MQEFSHLVHVKGSEHLLDVGVGLGIQASQAEELLELVQGELTRRTLSHELLVPEVHLHSLQVVHGASRRVPHRAPSKHLRHVTVRAETAAVAAARLLQHLSTQWVYCDVEVFPPHSHTTMG